MRREATKESTGRQTEDNLATIQNADELVTRGFVMIYLEKF